MFFLIRAILGIFVVKLFSRSGANSSSGAAFCLRALPKKRQDSNPYVALGGKNIFLGLIEKCFLFGGGGGGGGFLL